jgi:membrane-bound lytic murein transglycosylase A
VRLRVCWALLGASLLLSACSGRLVPSPETATPRAPSGRPIPADPIAKPIGATPLVATPVTAIAGPTARSVGVFQAPEFRTSPIDAVSAERALKAFRLSCPSLLKRNDQSGLTKPEDWKPACAAASSWAPSDAIGFFTQNLEMVQIGDGKSFATGYFEPEIPGSRERRPGYDVPVYARPPELREIDLGAFSEALKGKKLRGKVEGDTFVPFADRGGIEEGALSGRGLEIAWVADPVEFFFLQVQGSGRLKQPDGSIMRIGYDSQNGRDYTGIGKLMKDRGLLAPGQSSMQGIMGWLRANPDQGRAIMRENKSWVFFKEVNGAGPLGALGLPVTGRTSVAADPAFVPLGAPVFLSMDRAEASGLWIAQDTGGAIKGSNRFDTFWGSGSDARSIAGGMAARGTAFLLLPRGVRERIAQEQVNGAPPAP